MTVTARFVRGNKTLDIVYPYALSGFVPPSVRPDFNITTGTSANKTGGGELVGLKYNNRSISFGVRVLGTSRSQMETSVRKLQAFLAGATGEVTYFEYRDNTLPVPLYGQFGANLRYEIVTAETYYNNEYQSDLQRASGLTVGISLVVKPFALGSRQQLATASGGVTEDILGTADGTSRGLMVLDATTNKMTNPVWGSATWNTGWTAEANLIAAQNTNPDFVYPGAKNSAALTSKAAGSSKFYRSINVGNTNAHYLTAYVVKPDRSAVTIADVILYYGGNQTTTYTHMGNGVYQLSAGVTGVSAGTATGVSVSTGKSIYMLGMQIEEMAYPTALAFGDQIGCAWTGTAHASTSSRTAGRATIPTSGNVKPDQGAVIWAVKWPTASTLQPTWVFWDVAGVSFRAYFQASDKKIYFSDGTNLIASSAITFSAGDTAVYAATWSATGLKIYQSGVEVATGATYTMPAFGETFDIGRDEVGLLGNGTVCGLTIYDRALTASEVLSCHQAASAAVTSDRRFDYVPWFWTKDGDNILDNNTDASGSVGAPNANYAVAAGIPGSIEALTRYLIQPSTVNVKRVYLNRVLLDDGRYQNPATQWYYDENTTATGTGDSGGAVLNTSGITSSGYSVITSEIRPADNNLMNGNLHLYMRAGPGTAGGTLSTQMIIGGATQFITVNLATITLPSSGKSLYYLGSINLGQIGPFSGLLYALYATAATSTNVSVDFVMAIAGDVGMIDLIYASGALETEGEFEVIGNSVRGYKSTTGLYGSFGALIGKPIDLVPGKTNILISEGVRNNNVSSMGDTLKYTVYVTPRWGLI